MSATIRYLDQGHERVVELGEQPVLVGRISDCAICVKDGTVTRRHARIYLEAGGTWIADLGSDILCGRLELQYLETPAS